MLCDLDVYTGVFTGKYCISIITDGCIQSIQAYIISWYIQYITYKFILYNVDTQKAISYTTSVIHKVY